jgi:hypothetical protein
LVERLDDAIEESSVEVEILCNIFNIFLEEVGLFDFHLRETLHTFDSFIRGHGEEIIANISKDRVIDIRVFAINRGEFLEYSDKVMELQFFMVVGIDINIFFNERVILLIVGFNVFGVKGKDKSKILLGVGLGQIFFKCFKVEFKVFLNIVNRKG